MKIVRLLLALLLLSCRDAAERDSQSDVAPTQRVESTPVVDLPDSSASSADGTQAESVRAKDSEWREAAEHVVVATTEINLVKLRRDAIDRALWEEFTDPEMVYFDDISIQDHIKKWEHYRAKLLEKALAAHLDAESLGECLKAIDKRHRDGEALLPVRAYAGMHGGRKMWIIVCGWEYDDGSDLPMSHIRGWAMIADTQEVVGFFTCS